MRAREARQPRRDQSGADELGQLGDEPPGHAPGTQRGLVVERVELVEGPRRAHVVDPALVGQRHPARRTLEQPHVQVALEPGDLRRHRGSRQAERAGGIAEAAGFGDVTEGAQQREAFGHRVGPIVNVQWAV